ncbi:MAG: hypothetical protein KKD05_09090 [Candidatus Omnitrophica bacterium]|nr:hypothetical protein [Candidatus Omnitrophota bacterium]
MKSRLLILGLIISITVFFGCAKSEEGPRKLGKDVFTALKAKNLDAYLDLCLTITDKKKIIFFSKLTKAEKKAQEDLISSASRDIFKIKDIRLRNFNDVASVDGWEKATVWKIVLKGKRNVYGIISYDEVIVKFKQAVLPDLKIGKVVNVRDIWKVMDDQALAFKSRI